MSSSLKRVTFDTETTGTDTENDRIITCFMRAVDGDTVVFEQNWVIDPGVEVPKEASDVHGMTTEWVRENGRKDVETAIEEIVHQLSEWGHRGFLICAYNGSFDLAILESEAKRYNPGVAGLRIKDEGYLHFDPCILSRKFDKYKKGGHQLITVAKRNGIEVEDDRLHAADYDVEITEKLTRLFLNRAWKELAKERQGLTPDEFLVKLQGWQAEWKQEWATGLTAFFKKENKREENGDPIVVSGSFPW